MWLMVLGGALASVAPSAAQAQPSAPPNEDTAATRTSDLKDEDEGADTGTPRYAASDKLTNHVLLRGGLGLTFPAGSLTEKTAFADRSGTGLTFGGGIGYGLSRYLTLDLAASYGMLSSVSSTSTCAACEGRSFDVGLGLAYHLAQGLAIDPWISLGVGYRSLTITEPSADATKASLEQSFEGLDLARIGLGGDFFPLPWVGVGPSFDVAIGTTISGPAAEMTETTRAVYAVFQLGLRIQLDPVGRSSAPASRVIASSRSAQ